MWRAAASVLLSLASMCAHGAEPDPEAESPDSLSEEQLIAAVARRWEPSLFKELDTASAYGLPDPFEEGLTPCLRARGALHCVPGAFVIGNWQSGMKRLAALLSMHPDLISVSRSCFFTPWKDDMAGKRWLRNLNGNRPSKKDWRPGSQLLAGLDCQSSLAFYPDAAGRFHKWWEADYWPCKARCTQDKQCEKRYYQQEQWSTCKPSALAAHDRAVNVPHSSVNVTPPYVMRQFYGERVRLLVLLRCPVDRLIHAFYGHAHYGKHYGRDAAALHGYVEEQVKGWQTCVQRFSARRCAIHFEQLGKEQADVFFHCDQLIRGLYAIFLNDWLGAFPQATHPLSAAEGHISL